MNQSGGLQYLVRKLAAMGWLVLGRHEQARRVFDAMLRDDPRDAYALASRAHLHGQAGRRPAAIEDAQALVTAHPARAAADWFNLAYLLQAEDRHAEAEGAFRRALELDPKLDRAWYGLGLTLLGLGRAEEAIGALKRNTELQPMSPYGWTQLVRVHMTRAEPEEARRIIRHLKGFEPGVAEQLERETGLAA